MRDQLRRFVSAERGTLDALAARHGPLPRRRGGRSDALVVDAGVAAAVEWCRATELDRADASYAERLRAACAKHTRGFGAGLSDALVPRRASAAVAWLEAARGAPEYVRPRPKYYYFYEMMREKIEAHYPALPPPVMDKLLATDADELDLLLQYPEAIRGQTEEYLQVLRERGAEALETYKTPTLTWDEVRALKGGDGVVGLGAAGETTGGESVVTMTKKTKKNTMRRLLPSVAEEAGVSLEENADATRTVATSVAAPRAFAEKREGQDGPREGVRGGVRNPRGDARDERRERPGVRLRSGRAGGGHRPRRRRRRRGRRAHGSGKELARRERKRARDANDERRERRTTRRIGSIRVHAHERKRRRRFWDERRRSARGASP